MLYQADGGIDIDSLVIDLFYLQGVLGKDRFVEIGQNGAHAFHGFDHIGAGLAGDVEGNGRFAKMADHRLGFLVIETDLRNIAHRNPRHASRRRVFETAEDDGTDRIQRVEFALCANHIAALSFLYVARRDRGVGLAQGLDDLGHSKAVPGHEFGIDDDPDFPLTAAVDIGVGDAGHPFEPVLDDVLDKIAVAVDVAGIPRLAFENDPGDGGIIVAGGIQSRLVGLVGVCLHLVEAVAHQKQRPVHVLAHVEFKSNLAAAVFRPARHFHQAFQALELFFLAVDDFPLYFRWGCSAPEGAD